jgi:hypothetical protein
MLQPKGIITALVTPFQEGDESIDLKKKKKMIDFQCAAGVDGIFVSGSVKRAAGQSFTNCDAAGFCCNPTFRAVTGKLHTSRF